MALLCTATNKKLVTFLFWTPTKANYVSKWLDFQKKLIDTITTSNFYSKFKENNENDMAALFYSRAKSAQQLILTVLPFHPIYFPWLRPFIRSENCWDPYHALAFLSFIFWVTANVCSRCKTLKARHQPESTFLCNGIFLPKFFWPTVRKNCSSNREKTFEIRGWRSRICKIFEITRTIYSNSERSEQSLVTECLF